MRKILIALFSVFVIAAIVVGYFFFLSPDGSVSTRYVIPFIRNSQAHQDWSVTPLERCGNAPFLMPTSGLIGYLWDDSFKPGHRHQGIDIFAGTSAGVTPVFAAYDGYLTRENDWVSTVIIRVPLDPLSPDRQIWTYYTHMADEDGLSSVDAAFPPGTQEVFVKAGTYLGTQGNYSGTPGNPVGVHLHFSIVRDDGNGNYLNELEIENTLDPSRYLGIELNKFNDPIFPIFCSTSSN
jgi:hypothetical protein